MQLNIASPFFDKYWNIPRNHTSFFPRWWSNTSPNLSKKHQLLFILHVRSAIQTLQMGAWYVFLHYQSSIQFSVRLAKRLQILFSVSDSLWMWRTFVPTTATHPMSSKCSDHTTESPFKFLGFFCNFFIIHDRRKYQKSNWIYEKFLFSFFPS